ncbi:MAG: hypothetical protein OQK04_15540 [Kangiellaceae bacterium]|nr:hypothetical protein [Kangiellaceae bacterium]MCW9000122.1 hypothetical protein [Kangiellaceae bacterium]
MYIRIQDNSIRFRVSRNEAEQLLDGGKLEESLRLSPAKTLHYSIAPTQNENTYRLDESNNSICASINLESLRNELENKPSKKGITIFTSTDKPSPSLVTLEVDLKRKKTASPEVQLNNKI